MLLRLQKIAQMLFRKKILAHFKSCQLLKREYET